MSKMNPSELAKKIGEGLLSFPVTHFTKEFQFDEGPYREHISWLLEFKPAGLFAAGDVRHGSVKRCAAAVGEGAMAVSFVHRYLADH